MTTSIYSYLYYICECRFARIITIWKLIIIIMSNVQRFRDFHVCNAVIDVVIPCNNELQRVVEGTSLLALAVVSIVRAYPSLWHLTMYHDITNNSSRVPSLVGSVSRSLSPSTHDAVHDFTHGRPEGQMRAKSGNKRLATATATVTTVAHLCHATVGALINNL